MYCDIHVFATLLDFVKATSVAEQPQLTPSSAMSVLISSSFLQMERLVPMCTTYVADNLAEMLQQGADVASLAEPLLLSVCQVRP